MQIFIGYSLLPMGTVLEKGEGGEGGELNAWGEGSVEQTV